MELPTRYDHTKESEEYARWEKSGYFSPDKCVKDGVTTEDAEAYSIVLPPPNVTGTLHMGHAAMLAIEDALIRFARMQGKRTLWLPGTDHAAIATQSKVEKMIQKEEGKSRHDLGREEFLKRVEKFASESHDTIVRQVRRMGASIDWSREAFTLDEKRNLAVRTAFKQMHDLGLIYRGDRIVNWDVKGQTTVSDDEVEYKAEQTTLYTFRYTKDFPIAISTTRPETKVGDTAVAVHPDDARYKPYVGKTFEVNFVGIPLSIKVVADPAADPAFGTGAVGITPAHSMADFEIAERHNLPRKQIINEYGKMTVEGDLQGKKVKEAREWVVEQLRAEGLIEKEEKIEHNVATAQRSGGIIEPLPKLQWFVAVNKEFTFPHDTLPGIGKGEMVTLKHLMRHVVEMKQIGVFPERFEKIYFQWIDNLRDWCISRQIWYGHRVPAYYCKQAISNFSSEGGSPSDWVIRAEASGGQFPISNERMAISVERPATCPICKACAMEQDPDTLDTWFSSGLWTFSTLGWPHFAKTATRGAPGPENDFANYHPTSVLETGYDILFFWVARMVLMTTALVGEIPFRKVYLHGLVRDEKGRKMSKSLDNVIDPLEMADKYGADATRLSLVIGAAPGNDLKLSEDRIRGYRNFATKIWNASRFVLMNKPEGEIPALDENDPALKEARALKVEVAKHIEQFELHLAAEKAYHYFWHTFADKIIEEKKEALKGGTPEERRATYALLEAILRELLITLHPFMPFVTEAVWEHLEPERPLLITPWKREK